MITYERLSQIRTVSNIVLPQSGEERTSEEYFTRAGVVWMSGEASKPIPFDPNNLFSIGKHLKRKAIPGSGFKGQFIDLEIYSEEWKQVLIKKVRAGNEMFFPALVKSESDLVLDVDYLHSFLSMGQPINLHYVFFIRGSSGEVFVVFADWIRFYKWGWSLTIEKLSSVISTNYDYLIVIPL